MAAVVYEREEGEHWQTSCETLAKMSGDCEDFALLALKAFNGHGKVVVFQGKETNHVAYLLEDGVFLEYHGLIEIETYLENDLVPYLWFNFKEFRAIDKNSLPEIFKIRYNQNREEEE